MNGDINPQVSTIEGVDEGNNSAVEPAPTTNAEAPAAEEDVWSLGKKYADDTDTDIILYFGSIGYGRDDYIIDECRKRKRRKNVMLYLATLGGDPNAGYRIARCLQEAYSTLNDDTYFRRDNKKPQKSGEFSVLIDGYCKSAGTLICLGADKVIMSGNAQLGPIDIQLLKQDEVGERESGLTPLQAIRQLELHASNLFRRQFLNLRFSDLSFSTKMAKEVATETTIGLLAPLYSQIDPIRMAEVDRSMRIANEYGERLVNGNLQDGALEKLVGAYPSHGFVIDRGEALSLFKRIDEPCTKLRKIINFFRVFSERYTKGNKSDEPFVMFL